MKEIGYGQTQMISVFSSPVQTFLSFRANWSILTCMRMSQGHLKPNMTKNGTCDPPYLRKQAQTLTPVQYPMSSSI